MTTWNEKMDKDLVTMWNEGMAASGIAAHLELPLIAMIYRRMKELEKTGVVFIKHSRGGNVKVWNEEVDKILLKLRNEGKTWGKIREELALIDRDIGSVNTIRSRWIKLTGEDYSNSKNYQSWTKKTNGRLLAMRVAGKTWAEIGNNLGGRSRHAVREQYTRLVKTDYWAEELKKLKANRPL